MTVLCVILKSDVKPTTVKYTTGKNGRNGALPTLVIGRTGIDPKIRLVLITNCPTASINI